jgi:hypothetical protein
MSEDKSEPADDEELNKLLGELASTDPLNVEEVGKKSEAVYVPPKPRAKPIDVSIVDEDVVLEVQAPQGEDLSAIFSEQLQKIAKQYGSVFEDIIRDCRKDREQAQEVIDRFMDVICAGGKVPRIYLEKVADAVRAKNEIAQTAIKALDSLPKLISATKGNDMFTNNVGVAFDAAHLKEILEAAKEEDA